MTKLPSEPGRRLRIHAVALGAGAVLLALMAGCASAPEPQREAEAEATPAAATARPDPDASARLATATTTAAEREATRAAIMAAVAVATVPDGDGGIAAAMMAPPLFTAAQAAAVAVAEADAAASAAALAVQADAASMAVGGPSIRFKKGGGGADANDTSTRLGSGEEVDRGTASWYGLQFHGRRTANGERYDMYELTAAHKTLPFNTIVTVRSLQTGRVVRVRINDRGPFVKGRVIDLSKAAAEKLGMSEMGIKPVSLTVAEWPDGVGTGAEAASPRGAVKAQARRPGGRRRGG